MKYLGKLVYPILIGFVIVVTGCVTTSDDWYLYEEYHSPEEVLEAWMDGTYSVDAEQYTSAYWEDARKFYTFPEDEGGREYIGQDEIYRQISEAFISFDPQDFEFSDPEIYPGPEHMEVIFYYEDWGLKERLVITRRGELWGIEEQIVERYEAPHVASFFQEWVDENRNGKIEDSEMEWMMFEIHAMLFYPHPVETPLAEIFDGNEDGFIDEVEIDYFREYFYGRSLPRLFEEIDPGHAEFLADMNGNGQIEPFEVESIREYLNRTDPEEGVGDMNPDNPIWRKLDWNQDGEIEFEENMEYYWSLVSALALIPHDPESIFGDVEPERIERTERIEVDDSGFRGEGAEKILSGKRIAIVGIDSVTQSVSSETLSALVLFVENSFVNTGKVTVVDRKSVEKIIEEYNFQATGLTDEATAVEIGKIAGAEIIVTGTLSAIGSDYYLQLRLIDVATAEVVASSLGEAKIENEFLNMSDLAVKGLF
ncbi:MAG: hypothetical protein JEY91_09195 [Spirochaetaceae bacterium]|nr:hypothetical protein [Spirochaetaceae bacterium]